MKKFLTRYLPLPTKDLRRILGYVAAERRLFFLTVASGALGFVVTFIYPWLISSLFDKVIAPPVPDEEKQFRWLVWLSILGFTTPFLASLAGYGRGHFNMKMGNRIVTRLRQDLFDHLQKLSLEYYTRVQSGSILWKLMHEVHGINGLVHSGLMLTSLDVVQLVLAIFLMAQISGLLTFAVLAVMPLYILTFKVLNPRVRQASESVSSHLANLSGTVEEVVSGISVVKSCSAEEYELDRFYDESERHYRLVVRQSHFGHLAGATGEFIMNIATGIVIAAGGYLALHSKEHLSPGQIMAFLGYSAILYGPVRRFCDLNLVYQSSLAAVKNVFSIFDIKPIVSETNNPVTVPPTRGAVEFRNVSFSYPKFEREDGSRSGSDGVLKNVSFKIDPGKRVALVGPSGSGKSTIVSLIPRLYEVTTGEILIDDINVRDYSLAALRKSIAIVQQDSFLFSGTIRENIAYGKVGASMDEIEHAARVSNSHDFIMDFPDGYDSILGERGINLSGGQKQRIAIARAVLRDPAILILDEATSSLDTRSEFLVQAALERIMDNRTCFIIAHRLSTIRKVDFALVVDEGSIVERGPHDHLLESGGLYASLHRIQGLRCPAALHELTTANQFHQ